MHGVFLVAHREQAGNARSQRRLAVLHASHDLRRGGGFSRSANKGFIVFTLVPVLRTSAVQVGEKLILHLPRGEISLHVGLPGGIPQASFVVGQLEPMPMVRVVELRWDHRRV